MTLVSNRFGSMGTCMEAEFGSASMRTQEDAQMDGLDTHIGGPQSLYCQVSQELEGLKEGNAQIGSTILTSWAE